MNYFVGSDRLGLDLISWINVVEEIPSVSFSNYYCTRFHYDQTERFDNGLTKFATRDAWKTTLIDFTRYNGAIKIDEFVAGQTELKKKHTV